MAWLTRLNLPHPHFSVRICLFCPVLCVLLQGGTHPKAERWGLEEREDGGFARIIPGEPFALQVVVGEVGFTASIDGVELPQ